MAYSKLALILTFLIGLLVPGPAAATENLVFSAATNDIEIAPFLEVFEDADSQFGRDDLFNNAFLARFNALDRETANFGFSRSDWWVRFTVENRSGSQEDATVLLDYPLLDYVDVWVVQGASVTASWSTGNRKVFDTRPIRHRSFMFPVALQNGEQKTVYLRIRTQGPVNIGLSLLGETSLLSKVELEYLIFGAYFGGFLLLALCVSLLYMVDRQAAFLYYLIYILSYSSYMMAFNGLAFQYLWPGDPEFGQIGRPVFLTFALIFLLQFSRALLGIKHFSPLLHRTVTLMQLLLCVILAVALFVGYGQIVAPLAVLNLAALLVVIAMGLAARIQGEAAARYYLLAWSVFLAGLLAYLLKVFGFLPHNFITHYGFQIGSFFEFVFLSVALGVRVRELRRQSRIDELTGLPNRRLFDLALTNEMLLSERPNAELSLLVIDVDHFKRFNDRHGHAAGDRVLKELAQVFQKQIRRPGGAYRYGGEEFAVLLPRTGQEDAMTLAERLRESAASDISFDGVTISIGIATLSNKNFATASDFFIAGDKALYRAKNEGRNRVVVYDPEHSWSNSLENASEPTVPDPAQS